MNMIAWLWQSGPCCDPVSEWLLSGVLIERWELFAGAFLGVIAAHGLYALLGRLFKRRNGDAPHD